MAKRKSPEPSLVRVRVRTSFNGMHAGDEAVTTMDDRLQGWLNAGLVEVTGDGQDPAGQGSAEPDAAGGQPDGAGDSGPAGGEQGEGFGAGGYGAFA